MFDKIYLKYKFINFLKYQSKMSYNYLSDFVKIINELNQ